MLLIKLLPALAALPMGLSKPSRSRSLMERQSIPQGSALSSPSSGGKADSPSIEGSQQSNSGSGAGSQSGTNVGTSPGSSSSSSRTTQNTNTGSNTNTNTKTNANANYGSQFHTQEIRSIVNITTVIETGMVQRFRENLQDLNGPYDHRPRVDDIILCGGVADGNGGFTSSQALNVISRTEANEYTFLTVPNTPASGQGQASFFFDLCSTGEERGVLDRARFQCDFTYQLAPLSGQNLTKAYLGVPNVQKRINMREEGFEPNDNFVTGNTYGSSFTSAKCCRPTQPVEYTGAQPRSVDVPVYQFVVNGAENKDDLYNLQLCGALPATGEQGDVKYNQTTRQRFEHGRAFRIPITTEVEGEATLYYGKCEVMNQIDSSENQATHACTFKYTSAQEKGQPYPFASALIEATGLDEVHFGETEGEVSTKVELGKCEKLQQPVKAEESSSAPPPRVEESD